MTETDRESTPSDACRRSNPDRRQHTLKTLGYALKGGRRRGVRRAHCGNGQAQYVDWYEPGLLVSTLFILLLSVTDALLTLTLLHHGAIEANPVMAALLNVDVVWFAVGKMALTGLCLILLVTHTHHRLFNRIKIAYVLHSFVPVYIALITYELFLLNFLTS